MKNDTDKYILGVKISSTPKNQLLKEIEKLVNSGTKFSINTIGPEILLMSQKNSEYKKALNSFTFSVPDGIGLKLAQPSLQIIKGRELFLDLINLANKNSWKVFLLGGMDDEAEIVQQFLLKRYKDIKILSEGGREITTNLQKDTIGKINSFKPDLLFIAFGHPEQEIFPMLNAKKLNAKCIMTVGGTFRYIAGLSKLPPRWVPNWGEWLWRLITEPKRIKRIFNATILFPIEVLKEKIRYLLFE